MLSFAKATEFEDDLYSGMVAPKLNSNLITETWNNGKFKSIYKYFLGDFFGIVNWRHNFMNILSQKNYYSG